MEFKYSKFVVSPISVVPLEAVMIYKMYSWPLGDFGCGIATLLSELVTYVSIVTMIMFSAERCVSKNYFPLEKDALIIRYISKKCVNLNYLSNIFLDILRFAIPESFAFYLEDDKQRQSLL